MSERKIFNEWLKYYEKHDVKIDQLQRAFMWQAWQASANREGYKLVPAEATDSQWAAGIDAYTQAMHGQDILSASAFFDIYKAMIGAIE